MNGTVTLQSKAMGVEASSFEEAKKKIRELLLTKNDVSSIMDTSISFSYLIGKSYGIMSNNPLEII
jgi:hypothetical protein